MRRRATSALAFTGVAAGSVALGYLARRRALAGIEPMDESTWADLHRPVHGRPLTVRSFDRTRLHVEILGPDDAPTVVLAHGYALSQHAWHYQRRALSERFRVVCYDQRGHAASAEALSGDYSMGALGRDLAAVLDATTAPDERVVLVGHSMGA
jgi:predicted alpha/beta-fold hydrolase